jgi:cytoskeletal protein RodZ
VSEIIVSTINFIKGSFMDVDPKPQDQSLSSAHESEQTNNNMSNVDSPQRPVNPVIAAALQDDMQDDKEPETQPPVGSSVPGAIAQKKSHKKPFIIGLVTIALIAIAGMYWYIFYSPNPSAKTTATTTKTSAQAAVIPATPATNAATINSAVDALTTGASDATTAASTSDTGSAGDASTTAGNVGGSINENNF